MDFIRKIHKIWPKSEISGPVLFFRVISIEYVQKIHKIWTKIAKCSFSEKHRWILFEKSIKLGQNCKMLFFRETSMDFIRKIHKIWPKLQICGPVLFFRVMSIEFVQKIHQIQVPDLFDGRCL
jgi:hypothetical protein